MANHWREFCGQVLKLLFIVLLLVILLPHVFNTVKDLLSLLANYRDRVPSGNPMKVESPIQAHPEGRMVIIQGLTEDK